MLTLNNPDAIEEEDWIKAHQEDERIRYFIFQLEVGDLGTPHFQGYVEFKNPIRIGGIKLIFGDRVHIDKARGSQKQCIAYCSKEDRIEGPWEFGHRAKGDLSQAVDLVRKGKSMRDIAELNPMAYAKHSKKLRSLRSQLSNHRNWTMKVIIFYGPAGSGKSGKAHLQWPEAYSAPWPTGGRWFWPEYDGEETVILDEFRHQIKFDQMLKIMDRYALWTEFKGGNVKFRSKRIVITTNIDPKDWYPRMKKEKKVMLRRRIREFAELHEFTGRANRRGTGTFNPLSRLVPSADFEFNDTVEEGGWNFGQRLDEGESTVVRQSDLPDVEDVRRFNDVSGGIPDIPSDVEDD